MERQFLVKVIAAPRFWKSVKTCNMPPENAVRYGAQRYLEGFGNYKVTVIAKPIPPTLDLPPTALGHTYR